MITLRLNSKGFKVRKLQRLLRIKADGIFGVNTRYAVRSYQQRSGLVPDGVVGVKTWSKLLYDRSADVLVDNVVLYNGVASYKMPQRVLSMGDVDLYVSKLLGTVFSNTQRNKKLLINGVGTLLPYLKEFGLDRPVDMKMFIAQIREEVGRNITLEENLNYSCKALASGYPFSYYMRYRRLAYAHGRCNDHGARQNTIADHAYAYRMGNGSIKSREGSFYKGRGGLMITGKDNHIEECDYLQRHFPMLHRAFNPVEKPGLNSHPNYWLIGAAIFWKQHNLRNKSHDVDAITKAINPHTQSYASRRNHLARIEKLYA